MRLPVFVLIALVLGLAAGCGGDDQAASANAGQKSGSGRPGGPGGPGGRGPADLPPAAVAVAEVTTGPIASYYHATASLEAKKQAEVLARAEGMVGELLAEEGDRVAAGAPLLRIENDEYRFRVEQATARTAQLQAAYERLREMRAEDLATEEEMEAARADLASAEADEGLARLQLSYTTLTAPFAGVVTERLVDPGQNVSVGTALFTLADVTPLLARVHVPSREFRQLELDQDVELILDSTGDRLTGRIDLISPVIDPASGTIKVTVEVPEYPAGTRPGDFAEVHVVTELRPDAVLVPRGAVVTEKGESVVYVAETDAAGQATAARRPVSVGFTDDRHAQVLSGATPGERVVVKGQRSLKPGQPLQILEGPGAGAAAARNAAGGGRGAGGA